MRPLTLAVVAAATLVTGSAVAEEVTLDILYAQSAFVKFHDPIAQAFMAEHPDIKIKFLAPAKSYDEGHLLMQRLALTNQLPDMYFPGYHLLPELAHMLTQRGQMLDLQPLIDAEPAGWVEENYTPSMMGLGVVDGVKYGMAFNASLPILYVNESLLEQAGLDPNDIPKDWDQLLARAKAVHEAVPAAVGVAFSAYDSPDSWMWQTLLRQQGAEMVDPATGGVGFDTPAGLAALKLLPRIVSEGGENMPEFEQALQQFAAGQTAYFPETPARLTQIIGLVGDRFKLGTIAMPTDGGEAAGLPTGGSAGIITTTDPAKQAAAWEYLKFATGPLAQKIVVETTGYLPTNKRALGADYLGPFYQQNPRFQTVASEMPLAKPWQAYSKGSSVRIWRAQRDVIGAIMRSELSPEDGMKKLVEVTNALLE